MIYLFFTFTVQKMLTYFLVSGSILFCTVTNKCIIISQIITLTYFVR